RYQVLLAERIKAIEERDRPAEPGDDILLSVITDGRHAAIDMRLVSALSTNEPGNKLNKLVANVHRIWKETAGNRYQRPDSTPCPNPGAGQLIFSDLGTLAVEEKRGFSAYRWIRHELVRLGIPASEIAYMQHFKRSADKQRLFNDFNAGRIRILIGSSETMGTGVNVQLRLKALHHLDVPWLPSEIEQREGRIERQGNQHDEIEIYAYATLGSMDATMWQNNERKARFIAAALSGDRSIRTIEDIGEAANQFALAKAIASGDTRLMQKAGLESELARLERQRAAHFDDQLNIRRRIQDAHREEEIAARRAEHIRSDLARRLPTRGEDFAMTWNERTVTDRRTAGTLLLSKIRLSAQSPQPAETTLGAIGGFPLLAVPCRTLRSPLETILVLRRTEYDQTIPIEPDLTPMGLISRLEHILDHFELDLQEQVRRTKEAAIRRAGYEERLGEPFPLQAELEAKAAALAALDAELAESGKRTG
ncbi:MAG: helicase-related protein, partial [Acetobacteraceae bacterium]